ncbi:hypothetical protein C8Q80DRAFT_959876 [Daedaleopsis nitida]|nr:hypothetical protein C8Q80DRAFT_959876 [Daedaleopsis nitida]
MSFGHVLLYVLTIVLAPSVVVSSASRSPACRRPLHYCILESVHRIVSSNSHPRTHPLPFTVLCFLSSRPCPRLEQEFSPVDQLTRLHTLGAACTNEGSSRLFLLTTTPFPGRPGPHGPPPQHAGTHAFSESAPKSRHGKEKEKEEDGADLECAIAARDRDREQEHASTKRGPRRCRRALRRPSTSPSSRTSTRRAFLSLPYPRSPSWYLIADSRRWHGVQQQAAGTLACRAPDAEAPCAWCMVRAGRDVEGTQTRAKVLRSHSMYTSSLYSRYHTPAPLSSSGGYVYACPLHAYTL